MFHLKSATKFGKKFFWFVITARNGQTLLTSETYKTKRAALSGIMSTIRAVRSARGYKEMNNKKTDFFIFKG